MYSFQVMALLHIKVTLMINSSIVSKTDIAPEFFMYPRDSQGYSTLLSMYNSDIAVGRG